MQAAITAKGEKKKSEYGALVFFAAVLIAVYLARDIFTIPVPEIVITGWCALAFFILDVGDGLAIFALCLPLTVPQNEINIAYLVVMIVKLFIISNKPVRFGALSVTVIALILLIEMFNEFFYTTGTAFTALYNIVLIALPVIIPLIWYTCSEDFSREKIRNATYLFLIGVLIYTGIILYQAVQVQGWSVILSGNNRLGQHLEYETASDMRSRGNTNGISSLAATAFSLLLVVFDKKMLNRAVSLAGMIYFFFIVALTRSRGAELCLVAAVIIYALVVSRRRGNFVKALLILAAFAVAITALVMLFPSLWDGIIGRFVDQDDITNGRLDIAKEYIDALSSDFRGFLIGYGVKTYSGVVGATNSPHNILVDILVCWGIIGFVLVFWWLIMMLAGNLSRVDKKDRLIVTLPAAVGLLGRMNGQYTTMITEHLILCFVIMTALVCAKDETEGRTMT